MNSIEFCGKRSYAVRLIATYPIIGQSEIYSYLGFLFFRPLNKIDNFLKRDITRSHIFN